MSAAFDRLLHYPRSVAGVALALLLATLISLFDFTNLQPRFEVDPSMVALLPSHGAVLTRYEQARALFGNDDVLLVAWVGENLFEHERLERFKALTRDIERLPGVASARSLANAVDLNVSDAETRIDPYLRYIPQSRADIAALRLRALDDELISGQLIAPDGEGLLIAVRFEASLQTTELVRQVETIESLTATAADDIEYLLSGPLAIRLEISRILYRDLVRVIPTAILFTLIVAITGFRSVRGIVLPVFGNATATAISVAVFIHSGHSFNFVTVILPPVIYVIGFAYAIHVVCEFDRQLVATGDRLRATRQALAEVFRPLSVTALTTLIAFLALAVSEIESVRLFGLYTALGVGLAWVGAVVVVPAGLLLIPVHANHAPPATSGSRWPDFVARFNLSNRRVLLLAAAILGLLSISGVTRLSVDTRVLSNFSEESGVQADFDRLAQVFSGPVPLWITITANEPDAFKAPENLKSVTALEQWLTAQPEIGASYSIADYINALHRAVAPEHFDEHGAPTSARFVNHLLLTGGSDEMHLFADPSFSTALLRLRTTALSTAEVNRLSNRIEQRLSGLPPHLDGHVTGTSRVIAATVDNITRGQLRSLTLAFVGVLITLTLLFRSLRVGSIALIPNILPVLFYFGVLGYSPIPLSLTTSLVACAVFGIAIDDSVHFLSRYAIESARNDSRPDAIAATLRAVFKPVTLTTAALCAGFLALTLGELGSQADFGMLAALTLFFAWLIDIAFTPALCAGLPHDGRHGSEDRLTPH